MPDFGGMAMAGLGHGMAVYEPLLLALLAASGAGRYSLDHLIGRWARRAVRLHPDMPHVVIVGAGFGAWRARRLYAMNRPASR
jgi:hypothetical protein